jgi:uncharacterized membrane protein YgaE (UPF0421/DUF939 family)
VVGLFFRLVGIRVIKTAVAVAISLILAQWFGLQYASSAGLLAILGIEVTKKKGVLIVFKRLAASVMALLFSLALFSLLGFHALVVGLFILIAFPVLYRMKLSEGTITGSVVMFHIYNSRQLNWELLRNELLLLLIGLGTATLINIIYMPRSDKILQQNKRKLEMLFSQIFNQIAAHLRDNTAEWDGAEMLQAEEVLQSGLEIARKSAENHLLFGASSDWSVYYYMRIHQFESIGRMVNLVAQVFQNLPQGKRIAEVFEHLSNDVQEEYYIGRCEQQITSLEAEFRTMALPATRAEFEIRSALLQLIHELKYYMGEAKKQKRQKPLKEI